MEEGPSGLEIECSILVSVLGVRASAARTALLEKMRVKLSVFRPPKDGLSEPSFF